MYQSERPLQEIGIRDSNGPSNQAFNGGKPKTYGEGYNSRPSGRGRGGYAGSSERRIQYQVKDIKALVGKGSQNSHPSADSVPIKLDDAGNKENQALLPSDIHELGAEEPLEEQVAASIAARA